MNPILYQCPYEKGCTCAMEEPCMGCETYAETNGRTTRELELELKLHASDFEGLAQWCDEKVKRLEAEEKIAELEYKIKEMEDLLHDVLSFLWGKKDAAELAIRIQGLRIAKWNEKKDIRDLNEDRVYLVKELSTLRGKIYQLEKELEEK